MHAASSWTRLAGRRRHAGRLLPAAILAWLAVAASAAGEPSHRWAVLVGVNDYAEIQDLKYCSEDMQALRGQLVTSGFDKDRVVLLTDQAQEPKYLPFKANIERQLDLILGLVAPDDLVVFAFSGHGVFLDGTSYLCPTEARLEEPGSTMISVDKLYERLAKCPASFKLCLVDACRNDPRSGRKSVQPATSAASFAGSLERPPEGILLLTSCAPGQISMEDKDFGHGVFMQYVLEGLRGKADAKGGNGDGKVSLLEVYRYASQATQLYVARAFNDFQTPTLKGEITNDVDIATAAMRDKINVPDDFRTISTAMEAAAPGTTILVQAGMYEEAITLKSGVRLMGADKEKVVVRARDAALRAFDCEGGEVFGMTFEGTARSDDQTTFIVYLNNSKIRLSNCIVRSEDGKRAGIGSRNGDKSTVQGCTIDLCNTAIYVHDAGTAPTLVDNVCLRSAACGIEFWDGAGGVARANTCRQCQSDGIRISDEKTSVELDGNLCVNNHANGVFVSDKAQVKMRRNEIKDNDYDGIFIRDSGTFARLENNKAIGNRRNGLEIGFGGQAVFKENEARDSGWSGIMIANSGATLEGNLAVENTGDGIVAQNSNATLSGNTCRNNGDCGISFTKGASGEAKNNVCSSNGTNGIEVVLEGTNPTLTGNTCTRNHNHGIRFGKGALGRESGNTCTDNGGEPVFRAR